MTQIYLQEDKLICPCVKNLANNTNTDLCSYYVLYAIIVSEIMEIIGLKETIK